MQHLIYQVGKGKHTISLPVFERLITRRLEGGQVTSADEVASQMPGAEAVLGNANISFQVSMSSGSVIHHKSGFVTGPACNR